MDGAPRLVDMTNVRTLSRYRLRREQQARRVMQADATARDRARLASAAATAALASAEMDRNSSEQRYYRDLARAPSVTIEMLYRGQDELARLAAAVESAMQLAEAASAALAHCEKEFLRSTSEYRARRREVRKLHLLQERLERAMRSRTELGEELETEEQNSIRHANRSGERRNSS